MPFGQQSRMADIWRIYGGYMADIDDKESGVQQTVCPVIKMVNTKPSFYRVSWIVDNKRKEQFFSAKSWAQVYVDKLLDAAELVGIKILPLIADVYVQDNEIPNKDIIERMEYAENNTIPKVGKNDISTE
jgi:hypothetical protein